MSLVKILFSVLVLGAFYGAAFAGSMDCGSDLVEAEQREPETRASVLAKCGPPDSESGSVLVYERDNARYSLRFDANDELESISEELK